VLIEEKEIEHQKLARTMDQGEDFVEDLLLDHRVVVGVTVGEIGEEAEVGSGNGQGIATIDQVRRQRFDGLVAADERPKTDQRETGEKGPSPPRGSPGVEPG